MNSRRFRDVYRSTVLVRQVPRSDNMKPTQQLHDLGQSLWVDNITRDLLTSGTLRRYVDEFLVTGLTTKVVRVADVAVNITSRNDFVLTAADCLAV